MPSRVSLSELAASGVRLHPPEAVAIVSEICRQHDRGVLRGMPSAHIVRLTEQGSVVVEGPVNTDRPPVIAAASLLDELLENFDAPAEYRAPGALRLVVARALGTLDLPPYTSLEEFCEVILRFKAPDLERVVRDLFAQAAARMEPAEAAPPSAPVPIDLPWREALTISDVRRARRATGLSLDEISARAHIPTHLLRELEWGYLRNWPEGLYGRSQIVRYARGAGLDESVVLSVAWPLLEEAVALRGTGTTTPALAEQPIEALVPREPQALQPSDVIDAEVEVVEVPRRRGHALMFAGLAAAAMLVLALLPTMWVQVNRLSLPPEIASIVEVRGKAPANPGRTERATTGSASVDRGRTASETSTVPATERPTVQTRPPEVPQATAQPASYSPEFTNTGTAIFFSEPGSGDSGVVRADTAGRGETLKITRIVDDDAQNFHVRPSPDGVHIAFDSDREGMRAVFVADADGHNVRRISGDGFAAMPSWSPDSTQLAFVKGEAHDPSIWNLWTTDLVSGNVRRLTSYDEGQPWGGSWFPDGSRIAYSHGTDLVVMTLGNVARRTFSSPVRGHQLRSPAVSPDGRRIIFQVQRDGAWLLDLRTGSMRRVLDDPTAEEYTWSPDGHRVAFHSEKTGGWGVWVSGQ